MPSSQLFASRARAPLAHSTIAVESTALLIGRTFLPSINVDNPGSMTQFVTKAAKQIGEFPEAAADITLAATSEIINNTGIDDAYVRVLLGRLVSASCIARDLSTRA